MDKIAFKPVKKQLDIKRLASLAKSIWEEYFVCILTNQQISYMIEKFQSETALKEYITLKGYEYYFICNENGEIGYFGIHDEGESLFLSKLYLKADMRGKGIASNAFTFIEDICKIRGIKSIWLTVNKYNTHSIAVYNAKGFKIIDSEVAPIGNGFVMDDYIMQKLL